MNETDGRCLFRQMERRLIVSSWIANSMGATVVFISIGFLLSAIFDADQRDQLGRENWPLLVTSLVVIGLVLTWIASRERRIAFGWLEEGRDSTDEERRRTLRLPAFAAFLTAAGWSIAVVLGVAFNLDHSLGAAAVIGAALWVGAEVTSAIAFLITERTLRPVTAIVLSQEEPERFTAPNVRQRLIAAWSFGTAGPLLSVLAVGVVGLTKDSADTEAVAAACIFLAAVALCLGMMLTLITAHAIADPLASMRKAVERVAGGDLEIRLEINDASEVGRLQAGINRMADGLRERERIRDLFGRQVGHEVARAALRDGTTRLGGEEREIGALFVDLVGSTSMALAMPPAEVVRLLNKFFRVVIDVVESEGGFVNKFEGDAALCVFGAPVANDDPAGKALCAARKLGERLEREVPEVGFGIGVSAGKAVAGNVGSEQRFEYTVIGDPVNEAARLSDLAKERQMGVVASGAALDRAKDDEPDAWAPGERTVLRGRLEATILATPARTDRSPVPGT
jgi:adenylate cyclase